MSIVNGGFSGESNTTGMSTGDRIVLEDETTRGDSYSGNVVVQEKFTDLQMITDFFISNKGGGYTTLPTVSVTSSTGTNAVIKITVMKLVKL